VYSSKDIARKFIKMLSNNLMEAENRLLDLAYQSVRQRVAGALLKINAQQGSSEKNVITIARRDISNMIGTATESLNRTLADFKDEGLIEILGEGIRILRMDKLEGMVKMAFAKKDNRPK
jgi:CRP-like cAMP-binding protein